MLLEKGKLSNFVHLSPIYLFNSHMHKNDSGIVALGIITMVMFQRLSENTPPPQTRYL